jgi:alpha-amylase
VVNALLIIILVTCYLPINLGQKVNVQTYWWNKTVFYEIFIRSFYDSDGDGSGDFKGLIRKPDYLNDGNPATNSDFSITGIWLMPIFESPSYHGYDIIDYRSIDN